jgi:hypothetical protein
VTSTASSGRVLYLYGVVAGGERLPASELARLEAIAFSDLAAIVEEVPARDFAADLLERKLQDIDWIAPMARKHEDVLETILEHTAVIPAPICTLFSGGEAVRDSLAANRERFRALLSSLEGRREWGLKIYCRTGRGGSFPDLLAAGDPELRALDDALAAASPGQAYVLRKQRARRLDRLTSDRIDQVVDEALHAVERVAADTRLRRLPSPPALDPARTMVLNAAFLVDVAAAGELEAIGARLASRLAPEGFAFELTGPWPPYSFCDDEAAASFAGNEREEAE